MENPQDLHTSPVPRPPLSIVVPILAGITIAFCTPPFVAHVKSRNLAASVVIFWIVLINLCIFLNALIWPTDDTSSCWSGVGLCDVEVKLFNASTVALPGGLACIFRQLAVILDTDQVSLVPSTSQRRRRVVFEIVFCAMLPIYIMIAHFIVQPSRYYIFAIGGCVPSYAASWQSIILIFIWPVLVCTVVAVYCLIVVYRLIKYRRQFSSILSMSSSQFSKSRFIRLFALATTLVLIFLPLVIYILVLNLPMAHGSLRWKSIHSPGWSKSIIMVPTQGNVRFDRWVEIAAGFTVFIFFGFGRDAMLMYRSWLLGLGLGRVFPRLKHPHIEGKPARLSSTAQSSLRTKIGSISSRARLIFHRKTSKSTDSAL